MALALTGAGMITACGHGLAGSCAAIVAGISTPHAPAGPDEERLTVYPVAAFAEGFFQRGAWVRLAQGAVADLLHRAPAPPAVAGLPVVPIAPALAPARFAWAAGATPADLVAFLAAPLARATALPVRPGAMPPVARGHVGLAVALQDVAARASRGDLDGALLVAADSYLDPHSLEWLEAARRLKDPDHPTGLMPGEAGVALRVERPAAARGRGAEVHALVEGIAVEQAAAPARPRPAADEDGPPSPPDAAPLGRAVAAAVRRVLPPRREGRFVGHLVLDLNGETWRADAWGHAVVHLVREVDLDRCRVTLPAESLGETGAAAAGIGLCVSMWEAFRRRAAEPAVVVSVSDAGEAAAIFVSPAPR